MRTLTRKPLPMCSQCNYFNGSIENRYGICKRKKQIVLTRSKRTCCKIKPNPE